MKTLLNPITLICLFFSMLQSCGDKSEETIELQILKPGHGEVLQLDEPVVFEMRVNSSVRIDMVQIILDDSQSPADTIFNQALGQTGNFTISHSQNFDSPVSSTAVFNIHDGAGILRASDQVNFTVE